MRITPLNRWKQDFKSPSYFSSYWVKIHMTWNKPLKGIRLRTLCTSIVLCSQYQPACHLVKPGPWGPSPPWQPASCMGLSVLGLPMNGATQQGTFCVCLLSLSMSSKFLLVASVSTASLFMAEYYSSVCLSIHPSMDSKLFPLLAV